MKNVMKSATKTLMINDLDSEKELDTEAMQAVSGGFNMGLLGGQAGNQLVGGGGIFSPVTAVNTPINVPVMVSLDIAPVVDINLDTKNIIGSMGTTIPK